MRIPRMTTRNLMIAVAIVALAMIPIRQLHQLGRRLDDFYGSGGRLDLGTRTSDAIDAGSSAVQRGRYREAEAHYRAAIELSESLERLNATHGWPSYGDSIAARFGLADTLMGQGRLSEADGMYREAIVAAEADRGGDSPFLAGLFERYATYLREVGRVNEAAKYQRRADAMRERLDQQRRGAVPTGGGQSRRAGFSLPPTSGEAG